MFIEKYFNILPETVQELINSTENITNDKSGDNGFQSTKVFLIDDYAVLKMKNIVYRNVTIQDFDLKYLEQLALILLDLQAKKVNVVPILAFRSDGKDGYIVQQRAKGDEMYDRDKVYEKNYVLKRVEFLSNVLQDHFDKYIEDAIKIIEAGIIIDFIGKDNFFYHNTIGFQFIDLNAHFDYINGIAEEKPNIEQLIVWNCFTPCYYDAVPQYRNTVSIVLSEMDSAERDFLYECNKIIFKKCKLALLKNGFSEKFINEIISNERFIPQKQLLGIG